ncbi:hypothetical protein NFI96_028418 [Prochilodus magdalenae]|nr:hypothetical protein NFI96_028418 [Prochilodus magdalenae]
MKSTDSMFKPPDLSTGGTGIDLRYYKSRADSLEPSGVSMKSTDSMFKPPDLSTGGTGIDLRYYKSRADCREPRGVSMKSTDYMFKPPDLSTGGTGIDLRYYKSRADCREPSGVSMKSTDSMFKPPDLSTGGTGIDLRYYKSRADSPEPSGVSMKSTDSMFKPPDLSTGGTGIDLRYYKSRADSPEPSCVSMKSTDSMFKPPDLSTGGTGIDLRYYKSRADSPEPSGVSMKSTDSMFKPPDLSTGGTGIDLRYYKSRADSPEPSCVSMKSTDSMFKPPDLSTGGTGIDLRYYKSRADCREPSGVSMKSTDSMFKPPDLSTGGTGTGMSFVRDLLQDQFSCGVCLQLMTDPISITCGHRYCRQCISNYWDQSASSGDYSCPQCRKRSETHPGIKPHTEQDSHRPLDGVLQRVSERHKTCMKDRYESLFEGIKTEENKTLLNRIYTQLYIIEGESEGVNEEHEVLQIEKTFKKQYQDTPISYLDIFRPVNDLKEEMKKQNMAAGGKQQVRDEGKIPKQLRTVLTKGIAGIGKTVSVQKFILDWAEGKENQDVDLMFVLPFRELNLIDDQFSLHRLLCDFHSEVKDLDPETFDVCKVVFIFDGLDESRIPLNFSECEKVSDPTVTSSVSVLITSLIKGELLPSAHIWLTSRPAAANQIPPQYINRVTEIQGFSDQQKEEYFRKRISDKDQARRIISHIKTARSLHIMCHIPVFCWISATVLQRILKQGSTEIPKTLTEMYAHFLLTQTHMKNKKYEEKDERDPKNLLESNRTMLLKLAELAFKQLMMGNVMFYEEDLRECGIDVTEALVYSGICTEIFKEECVIHQRKIYCFVHLSFQEFLAALYVFHCYASKNMKELQVLNPQNMEWSENDPLHDVLIKAVDKALESKDGHLDLFLRFLLGISLGSNQKLLQGLLTQQTSSESISETVQHIKQLIRSTDLPAERSINLFLCLTEMNDQSLSRELQEYLKSEKCSKTKLSPAHCSAIAYMLQVSEEVLEELDLKKFNTSEEGYRRLVPAVSKCRKALLANCNLTKNEYEILSSDLKSASSVLKELDLSNNELYDDGVELLSAGLKSSHCKLEILRLAMCKLSTQVCDTLQSVFQSENCSLKTLDLSNNDLHDSGVELLSAGLRSSHCKLEILRLSGCMITEKGCSCLASAVSSNPTQLKELDLTYNHPGESVMKLTSDGAFSKLR